MPLETGSSPDVIRRNAALLIKEGRKPNQAVAIAYSQARKSKRKKRNAKVPKGVKA
jgi:hypothetical protein